MSQPVKRVTLPSGGWWEIVSRPQWQHVRQWCAESQEQYGSPDLVERALASLTTAWSFEEEIGPEALTRRNPDDLIAILETFQRAVIPTMEADSSKEMAGELFAGLISGQIPLGFVEVHVMVATGWSWQTLQETPADVVQRMLLYLAVKQARDNKASLEFRNAEEAQDGQ